jgi:hypothetical protein
MANNNIFTIGDTPIPIPITQSVLGDFAWTVEFLLDDTGETKEDVSDSTFEFIIYEKDGATPIMELELGDGIAFVDDYSILVSIALEDYTDLIVGCRYIYLLRQISQAGFRKPLFKSTFTLTK